MNNLYTRSGLPEEINSILSSCKTNEEAIQKISEKPENLIRFFEIVSNKDNEWHLKNSKAFYRTFRKVSELNTENKLNNDQIKRISDISKSISLLTVESRIKTEIQNFFYTTIENQTGVIISEKENILDITINTPKVSLAELKEALANLSKIYPDKSVKINLTLHKPIDDIEITKFIQEAGEFIVTLDLEWIEGKVDDAMMQKIIKHCPSLNSLKVDSGTLTSRGLQELSHLNILRILSLSNSSNLENLPTLPKGLHTLELSCNKNLTSLPDLPDNLKVLALPHLDGLEYLPTLPETLEHLNAFGCVKLMSLPILPNSLESLTCSHCKALKALPVFPINFKYLNFHSCSGLSDEVKLAALSACFDVSFENGCKFLDALDLPKDKVAELISDKFGITWFIENLSALKDKFSKEPVILNSILKKIMKEDLNSFLENLDKIPFTCKNAIDFFEIVCDKDKQSILNNSPHLDTILKKICNFSSYSLRKELNRNDIEKLIEVSKIVNSSSSEDKIKDSFNQFFKDIICEQFHVLEIKSSDDISITMCAISEGSFFDDMAWLTQKLSRTYPDKTLKIDFTPMNLGRRSWKIPEITQFIQEQGKWITTIDLRDFPNAVDDLTMQEIIRLCPGVNKLIIHSSPLLSDQGLKGLSSLSHLELLEFADCDGLINLPDLPMNLKSLSLHGCSCLVSLPIFPASLEELDLSSCNGLTEERRFETLSKLFDSSFEKGLKFVNMLNIRSENYINKIGELICEKFDISLITENFSTLKETLSKQAMIPIVVKIIKENVTWFVQNQANIPVEGIDRNLLNSIPGWQEIHSYALIKSQVQEKTSQRTELEIKDIPEIQTNDLLTLFDDINFTNANQANYINPHNLQLDGEITTPEHLREGIRLILERMENNTEYVGVPHNEEERRKWYQRLGYVLKAVIKAARESSEKTLVSSELLRLGAAGHNCGPRWLGEGKDVLTTLTDWGQVIENDKFESQIDSWIDQYKEGIMQQLTLDFTPRIGRIMQPHIFNYIGKVMKDQRIAYPSETMIDLNDYYMPRQHISEAEIKEKIDTYFDPLKFADFIQGRLNEKLQTQPNFNYTVVDLMNAYAGSMLSNELRVLENSLEEKKLEYGIKETEDLLKNRQIQKVILSGDADKIKSLGKENPLLVMQLRQMVKAFDDEDKARVDTDIENCEKWLQDKVTYSSELKAMGAERATSQLVSAKDDKINKFFEEKNLLTCDKVTDLRKITLHGTMALLEYLKYFEKIQ
jgi:hypothetical protein